KYRQIIQNLRSGRKVKDIRQLQSRFSFTDSSAPHIDKVVNGTIEKNLDFDAVKRMLVEIASDHLARNNIDEKEQISLNKEDISHWLADIQASRAIQKVADKIALWQTDFTNLDSLLNKLQHLHFEMLSHQQNLQEKQQSYQEKKNSTITELEILEAELKLSAYTLRQDISKLAAKIEADQSRIDLLDEDKLNYEDNDAASFQLQADQAPRFQQELNEVNEIIAAFEGNISKIQAKFEKLITQVKQQKMVDLTANKEQSFTVKESASVQLGVIAETQQAQLLTLNEQLSATNLKLNMAKQALENEVKQVQQQQNNPSLEPELIESIDNNQQNLGQCHETHSLLLAQQNGLNSELAVLQTQRSQLLEKHSKEGRYLDKVKTQRHEVECQLLPKEGSLQHFLTNEPEAHGWKDSIGRLLSTEQLNRSDLTPKWCGKSDDFYGLQIDLMQIQESDLQLGEDQLREKANDLDSKVLQLTENISGLELQIGEYQKQIQALQLTIAENTQSIKQNELKLEQLKTQKTHLNDKKQRAIKAFQLALDEKLKQLFSQQKDNRQKIELFQEQQQDERLELHNVMLEQRMVVESDRDSQLDELTAQRQKIEQSASERLRDYKKQHSSALSELDPDGEVDKRTKQRIELEKALDECAVWSRKAREYAQFMNERYVHRDKLAEENQNREVEKRGFENSLEELQSEKGQLITDNQKSLKKLNNQIRNTTELLTQLSDSQRLCEKSGIAAIESQNEPSNEADLTVSFCFDWLKQFETVEKRLSGQLQRFNETFKKNHASSELFENWQKLVADNDNFQGARNLFKYRDPIMDLLSSAEQKQKNTYQLVTVNANMINEFYQHIENFGRRIKSIGKQLSKSVTSLVHFEALADINVYTVMKQEELEYWGPLQQFAKLFEQHRDELREGNGEIPDDLVYAMQKLSTYLPSEGFVLAHHNLFDIEFSISEKGQLKYARNARQLKKISSTGLSYLAMLSLFAGILGMLRGESESPSNIILPVDELGELAAENVDLLLKMFSDNHISMLSASPSTDRHILSLYKRHYKIKDNKIFHAQIPLSRIDELLAMRAQKQQQQQAEASNV
ncbi:MAG: ATP-binding protein, partial [Alteromonadales bacterium]|nr:ATP-binding protein [Alteromonadales bacterium]